MPKQQTAAKRELAFLRRSVGLDEAAALHVEADCFDPAVARLKRVAVVRISGDRILSGHSRVLDCTALDCAAPAATDQIMPLLRLIGARPLLGFFVDFSVAMLEQLTTPLIGEPLRNQRIEVSSLYYESKPKTPGKNVVNLRLASILEDLHLPPRSTPGALDTAISTGLIWLRLNRRQQS